MTTYALTSDPDAVLMDGITLIPRGHRWWSDYQAWLAEGNTASAAEQVPEPVTPTVADLQAQLAAIQDQLAQLSTPTAAADQADTQ